MKLTLQLAEQYAFYLTFFSYGCSMVLYWLSLLPSKHRFGKPVLFFAMLGLVGNTAAILLRTAIIQRPPLANGYEFLLAFSWGIIALYLLVELRYKLKGLGAFVLPIAYLLLLFILLGISPEQRLAGSIMPALKSNWLTVHVFTAVLAYGAFAIAAGLAAMFILKVQKMEQGKDSGWLAKIPTLEILDELAYKLIGFAFLLLSLCIITGAVWANETWGTYWSWDPKETWALITWIIYAGYLHTRLIGAWKGKRAAYLAIIGFVTVIFSFFGVNYLLSGLHSYV